MRRSLKVWEASIFHEGMDATGFIHFLRCFPVALVNRDLHPYCFERVAEIVLLLEVQVRRSVERRWVKIHPCSPARCTILRTLRLASRQAKHKVKSVSGSLTARLARQYSLPVTSGDLACEVCIGLMGFLVTKPFVSAGLSLV